jgi:hypothetical protein
MAPELAAERSTHMDGRADQFALAAVAYRLLTGSDAFPGNDVRSVFFRVLNEAPKPRSGGAPLDAAVYEVLRKGMARDPRQRFASVSAFARAFADALGREVAGSVPEVTQTVSQSQFVASVPLRPGALVLEEQDEDVVSEGFFAEGTRQEAAGHFVETNPVYVGSVDRLPRNRWPMLLLLLALLGAGGAAAWWLGWRPPTAWTESRIWQTLHLPTPAEEPPPSAD